VLAAIAVTTAMDAGGLFIFSALSVLPLMGLFWFLERLPRGTVGMAWGRGRDYWAGGVVPAGGHPGGGHPLDGGRAADVSRTDWLNAPVRGCPLVMVEDTGNGQRVVTATPRAARRRMALYKTTSA